MGAPHFDYPDAASPTSTFTFEYAEYYPHEYEKVLNQRVGRAEDKSVQKVATMGNPLVKRPLRFRISRADADSLWTFLNMTVGGTANEFDYTDARDNVHTVRFVGERVKFSESGSGKVSGVLDLEELT